MTMRRPWNEPAFPRAEGPDDNTVEGINTHAYFFAAALTGILANPEIGAGKISKTKDDIDPDRIKDLTTLAWNIAADCMARYDYK